MTLTLLEQGEWENYVSLVDMPGWHYYIDRFNDNQLRLWGEWKAPDKLQDGKHVSLKDNMFIDADTTKLEAVEWMISLALFAADHEVRETFRVGDVYPFDPHVDNKSVQQYDKIVNQKVTVNL